MEAPAATDIEEARLVRWMFGEEGSLVCPIREEIRVGRWAKTLFEVPTVELVPEAAGPGDIDVLLIEGPSHERAIAIEAKRIKIPPHAFRTGRPGKISGLKQGVAQANLLQRLGFSRAYLLIAIVTDGREREEFNFAFRGPPLEMMREIEGFGGAAALHPEVGLGFVYVTQPVDKDIQWAGAIGVSMARHSQEREQSASITEALVRLLG